MIGYIQLFIRYIMQKNEIRVQISFFLKMEWAFLDMTRERYDMLPIAKWNEKMQNRN